MLRRMPSWTRAAAAAIALCGGSICVSCTATDRTPNPGAQPAASSDGADQRLDPPARPEPTPRAEPVVAVEPELEPEAPIEHRRADRAMMLYAEPGFDAPFRGKISHGEVFAVVAEAEVEDPRCRGNGWARVGKAAFACIEHTSSSNATPEALPRLPPNRTVPFWYARLKAKRRDGTNPPAPIWRTRTSLREGRPPIGALEPERVYAFDRRRRTRQGAVLESRTRGVVREADVKPLEPRDFEGRDLLASPVPLGMELAWTVTWPQTTVFAEPRGSAPVDGRLSYHEPLLLVGPEVEHRGQVFHRLASPRTGWVDASEIRRWIPMPPPEGVGAGELWLDIELDQQTLTVVRGETPEFVTLVSTGTWKDPTPAGLFRIGTKEAYGDMRSRAGEDDRYHVEAVPWVQYFHKRYALHGAYWHGRFGHRTSHGCVNLSPKDAARVFSLTKPRLPDGWIMIYEHPEDLGTLVRVRKLGAAPPDRRGPPRERRASDYG
jgi:hypothetical protein